MNKALATLLNPDNNIFQSNIWESYQEALGNKTFWVGCDDSKAMMVKLPLYKDKSYLYCPRGPQCGKQGWHVFVRKAKEIALQENCVFIRIEPFAVPLDLKKKVNMLRVGAFSPLSRQYSPMDTQILDIEKRDDDLLLTMKPKWRYNIKLAYRKGVQVRESSKLEDLRKFHDLSVGMKDRGYTPFGLDHYERLLYTLTRGGHVKMYIAEYNKQVLSTILVTHYGEVATYLHGASSDDFRVLMPNHLVQWEAMLAARRAGCKVYDFWGIAPENSENHSWAGITRFKKGFGGQSVHFIGAYDIVVDSKWYYLLYVANLARKLIKR